MTTTVRSVAASLTLVFAACGGGGAKYKVDDVSLASIPLAEKQAIFTAQNEVAVARSEHQKAQADAQTVESDLQIASKEREQARLEVQKTKLELDAAERSKDTNRQQAAARDAKIAQAGEAAADSKVSWLGQLRRWHRAYVDAAEAGVHLAEARYELEKAKLADAKSIKPTKDFNLTNFSNEFSDKERRWSERRRRAEEARAETDRLLRRHEEAKAQWMTLKGQAQPMPAPPPPPAALPAAAPAMPATPAPGAAPPPGTSPY